MSIKAIIIYNFFFFTIQAVFCQEQNKPKETIFIFYDDKDINNKEINIDSITSNFYIGNRSYFSHNKSKQKQKFISENDIPKLITEKIAFEKIMNQRKKNVKKWRLKNPKNIPPPITETSYNSYFEKVFLYKRTTSNAGILYEVSWHYYRGIE